MTSTEGCCLFSTCLPQLSEAQESFGVAFGEQLALPTFPRPWHQGPGMFREVIYCKPWKFIHHLLLESLISMWSFFCSHSVIFKPVSVHHSHGDPANRLRWPFPQAPCLVHALHRLNLQKKPCLRSPDRHPRSWGMAQSNGVPAQLHQHAQSATS